MYPRHHGPVSGAATLAAAVYYGLGAEAVVIWTALGAAAGVLIDADHIPVAMLFNDKVSEGIYWMKHPVRAVFNAVEMRNRIDPDKTLRPHRMASHLLILTVLIGLRGIHPLLLPVTIGVAAHTLADLAWDIYEVEGVPYI